MGTVFSETQKQLSSKEDLNRLNWGTSTGARLSVWVLSIEQVKDRPLPGSGIGSYGSQARVSCGERPDWDVMSVHPHNQSLFSALNLDLSDYLLILDTSAW